MPRLRVLAGPSPDSLTPITNHVNTAAPHRISSELFEGDIVVNVKGFTNSDGGVLESEYFDREDRKGVTWSIQVQGRFLQPRSADEILFGNTFDRPLKLPWGSGAALKFMSYVDPTLEHDLASQTRPWALSPLVSTMPHFTHKRLDVSALSSPNSSVDSFACRHILPSFPPKESVIDDTSELHLTVHSDSSSGSSSSLDSLSSSSSKPRSSASRRFGRKKAKISELHNASERRSYFSNAQRRKDVEFGPDDVVTTDFCYGFLEFSPSLALRLPGGVSFDLMRYWDGQPVRFVCCERGKGKEPWGEIFWCVTIELDDN